MGLNTMNLPLIILFLFITNIFKIILYLCTNIQSKYYYDVVLRLKSYHIALSRVCLDDGMHGQW